MVILSLETVCSNVITSDTIAKSVNNILYQAGMRF